MTRVARTAAWGRFDDLRSGMALRFPQIVGCLVARDVPTVLAEVERAMRAGRWAFGFVAYEAAAGLDPTLAVHEPADGLPLAWFGVTETAEHVPVIPPPRGRGYEIGEWRCEWGPAEHHRRVAAVRQHIAAGETYQCNLTTRITATVRSDLLDLYADLARAQGGTYNAYLDPRRPRHRQRQPRAVSLRLGDRRAQTSHHGHHPRTGADPCGVYCGAIGVDTPSKSAVRARFSVTIRTLVADRTRGTAEYGTGGGITWDSSAAAEYAELQAKAAILPTGAPTRPTRVATSQEKGTPR
jgi:hypothetical protein